MPFWTSAGGNALAPKKKADFLVKIDNIFNSSTPIIWWAKSASKPTIQYQTNAGPQANAYIMGAGLVGQKMGIVNPGGLEVFAPINVVMVDPDGSKSKVTRDIMDYMHRSAKLNDYYGLDNATKNMGTVTIQQLGLRRAQGEVSSDNVGETAVLETWTLYQAHITGVTFGDLNYAEDTLLELTLKISYTGFTLQTSNDNNENVVYSFGNVPGELPDALSETEVIIQEL